MDSLSQEVAKIIQDTIEAGNAATRDWITDQILNNHRQIYGRDAPFYRLCARDSIDDHVRKQLGHKKGEPPTATRQMILPGFEHLQKAYFITREDEIMIVPVGQCTDRELLDRADQFDAMADGLRAHAIELRELVYQRNNRAA